MLSTTVEDLLLPALQAAGDGEVTISEQRSRVAHSLAPDLANAVQNGAQEGETFAVRLLLANHLLCDAGLLNLAGDQTYALSERGRELLGERPTALNIDNLQASGLVLNSARHAAMVRGMRSLGWGNEFNGALAEALLGWRTRQPELIAFLESLRQQNLVVTPLQDRDASGQTFLLREIDPFTFIGTMNRGTSDENRFALARAMRDFFQLDIPVPKDFDGVPILNNMKSWLINVRSRRGEDDVDRLWDVLELALRPDPWSEPRLIAALDRAFALKGVNVNLTIGLFWIRPQHFVSFDRNVQSFLRLAPPKEGFTGRTYGDLVKKAREIEPYPIALSIAAWLSSLQQSLAPTSDGSIGTDLEQQVDLSVDYWLVGAQWQDESQTERFLKEGIWENGYEDRYLDDVRSMRPGDKIAIKKTYTQRRGLPFDFGDRTASVMQVLATGTVLANPGDGRRVEVDWDPDSAPREWYHYTGRRTVWHLSTDPGYGMRDDAVRLINFVWNGRPQDLEWYAKRWIAWKEQGSAESVVPARAADDQDEAAMLPGAETYGVEDIKSDGVFLSEVELDEIIAQLKLKRALILQGPPGVGKTFLARRVAYAVLEERDDARIQMVQFHQSYAYEDFVRGFRPAMSGTGFDLRDGVFLRFCQRAQADPERDYVFIVDEINRGNLSQIFGEMLMLIEGDKRHSAYAMPLAYPRDDEERFYIPKNVHLLGLMNLADRSLAMVDYALRRRFSFVDLEPQFDSQDFTTWFTSRAMSRSLVGLVVQRMTALNSQIEDDPLLGRNYRVGHSYFCPSGEDLSHLDRRWFERVVLTEIGPLLHEYWFDDRKKADAAIESLLAP